jgi:hypothetical protein
LTAAIAVADDAAADHRPADAGRGYAEAAARAATANLPELRRDRIAARIGLGRGRYLVGAGRLAEGRLQLRRAQALAQRRGWPFEVARADLELATAAWMSGDPRETDRLVRAAYPEIVRRNRADEVSRSWLLFGLIAIAAGDPAGAEQAFGHAERHWREFGRPRDIHRILAQRAWAATLGGRFDAARDLLTAARAELDRSPQRSWADYARLDHAIATTWRGQGEPDRALEAELPAALALDAARFTLPDPHARAHWSAAVAGPVLAGAFAIAHDGGRDALLTELIEHRSVSGALRWEAVEATWAAPDWSTSMMDLEPDTSGRLALYADPAPALLLAPQAQPALQHYLDLAEQRYGVRVRSTGPAWETWR